MFAIYIFILFLLLLLIKKKVSTSCSSVYVDGTETEGSSNASIVIKYGSNSGLARFTVWMPEYPLEVAVTDFRLSQIKGWKIPVDAKKYDTQFLIFGLQSCMNSISFLNVFTQ